MLVQTQTYGVLQPQPTENPVFNTYRPRGFFSGSTSTSYSAITTSEYVYGVTGVFHLVV